MEAVIQGYIVLSGIGLICVSILMFVSPKTAIRYLGKGASTNFINYLELTLRGIWGIALVLYAGLSKFPEFFQIFGIFVVITTAVLLLIPRKWHAWYAVWCSKKFTALYMKVASPFSLAFGIFIIYAVV